MDVRYINSFIQAVQSVFETQVHTAVRVGKPTLRPQNRAPHDVSGVIGFSGDAAGCVVLSFPMMTACRAASALTGTSIDQHHPDFADAIGTLTNLVAGSAKSHFSGLNTSFSLPSVILGTGHTVSHPKDQPRIIIPCSTDLGTVYVEVGMSLTRAASAEPQATGA